MTNDQIAEQQEVAFRQQARFTLRVEYNGCWYQTHGETREEAAESMAGMLAQDGYTFPKPWQFWRWGEHEPGPILRQAIQQRLPNEQR